MESSGLLERVYMRILRQKSFRSVFRGCAASFGTAEGAQYEMLHDLIGQYAFVAAPTVESELKLLSADNLAHHNDTVYVALTAT